MFYSYDLTIPADTAAASPAQSDVEVPRGLVHRVEIQFPPGCRGLVHVRVLHALYQVWPTNPDGDFATDGFVIGWNESWELVDEPEVLRLEGWSPGTAFPHTITFRFGVLEATSPAELLVPALVPVLGILEV